MTRPGNHIENAKSRKTKLNFNNFSHLIQSLRNHNRNAIASAINIDAVP